MSSELFIALHVEELPARFVDIAERGLRENIQKALKGIPYANIQSWASPRYIAVSVRDLARSSAAEEKLITGPPERAAFRNVEPTKVAIGELK